jgi:hypothetical protein
MKRNLKIKLLKILPKSWSRFFAKVGYFWKGDHLSLSRRLADQERSMQLLALYQLREKYPHGHPHSPLNSHELSVYSQNGEDGILLYLFSLLGTTGRRFVEFGIGDGKQCNSANLSINFGWSGLLLEANEKQAIAAQEYYRQTLPPSSDRVHVLAAKVTPENINNLLSTHGMTGDIDLLSIDIDGNDYWVWQSITILQPRVVVIEYNPSFGPTESMTVVNDPNFDRLAKHPLGYYHGASLAALEKLGQAKGYILAGCDSSGTNAFFVRQDVATGKVAPVTVANAFFPGYHRLRVMSQEEQFKQIAHYPFKEI